MVIITIGESRIWATCLKACEIPRLGHSEADMSLLENVFAAGDVIKPGLLADAIGTGIKAAEAVDASLHGVAYAPVEKKPVPSGQLSWRISPVALMVSCLPRTGILTVVSVAGPAGIAECACPAGGAISRKHWRAARIGMFPIPIGASDAASAPASAGIWTMHLNVPLE
ncbi:MAG: hypothetical protein ACLSAH_05655 [Bilophila wadsworthia]